jgi:hypothetical protein
LISAFPPTIEYSVRGIGGATVASTEVLPEGAKLGHAWCGFEDYEKVETRQNGKQTSMIDF